MSNRAFTMLEILAATTLAATLAISAGTWLVHLQKQAMDVHQQADAIRSVLVVCSQLRHDLSHADGSHAIDLRNLSMVITADANSIRQEVHWTLEDGRAIRAYRATHSATWQRDRIADHITALSASLESQTGRWHVRIADGTFDMIIPVSPEGLRAP